MKRFIKTFTIKRHSLLVVEQDGDARTFTVKRWDAEGVAPVVLRVFTYDAAARNLPEVAGEAIAFAKSESTAADRTGAKAQFDDLFAKP